MENRISSHLIGQNWEPRIYRHIDIVLGCFLVQNRVENTHLTKMVSMHLNIDVTSRKTNTYAFECNNLKTVDYVELIKCSTLITGI